jgi:hypothetical protein
MNVFALDIHRYNQSHFYFLEHIPNIIIDGTFTKIIYTGDDFTMNGIYIYIPLENSFEMNIGLIEKLEIQLLTQYRKHTTRQRNMTLGLIPHKSNRLHIKKTLLNISGVWENETHIGLTYKWTDGAII